MFHKIQNGEDKGDDVVLFQGSLEKRGFSSEWKSYWFVLRGVSLAYYAHAQVLIASCHPEVPGVLVFLFQFPQQQQQQ